jgi:hypothetical protein
MSPRTRTLAAISATLMLACTACSSPVRTGTQVTANQPFTLRPGEQAALPRQASLRYVGVDNDSRCPPTVTCVWAGDAQVKLVFEQAGKAVDVVLHSADPSPRPLQQWTLTLVALEPGAAPAATLRLDEAPR